MRPIEEDPIFKRVKDVLEGESVKDIKFFLAD